MILFATGLSYKTAPVEIRERIAVIPSRVVETATRLKSECGLSEIVLLSTCNRVEIYGAAPNRKAIETLLNSLERSETKTDFDPYAFLHTGPDAARHLFAVAGGLESMVLGETEITGQVKTAYETAHAAGLTGPMTNRLFQKALQTAKAIRTRTQIGRGATSVGSVAVELAEKIFGTNFKDKTVMIIGAGKMGEACVRHLAKKGAGSVIVANRTLESARQLADDIGGRAVNYMDEGLAAMREADIVVSSTGCPETILDREDIEAVMGHRPAKPLFLIDIAVPRDIAADVEEVESVYLYNIDHLQELVNQNLRLREQEVDRCREVIEEQTAELMEKLNGPPRKPDFGGLAAQTAWGFSELAQTCSK
jgi:glutamyl-tRNA reductase